MSLDTRVIAALGAVVVIGAGTLGGSIAYASGQTEPLSTQATVTIGRDSTRFEPSCYNGGKPFDDATNTACAALSNDPTKFKSLSITSVDRIGVGIDVDSAKNGWSAYTNGGGQGNVALARYQKDNTFSGLVPATNVLTQVRDTTLTVVEYDPKTASSGKPNYIAVWFVNLKNNAAPVGSAQPQDAPQGQ
ncbi:hypothetical protein E6W39_18560 [Kitasatospora acidiphila]|uniref:Uncharacterized protein n=1 Tax=Kitasatospora acidiphila TaxID=2567942 RepID=A0A540W4D6_9ACTN|nr:hypothetical protein [Kitasatospora acidiphila]TQF03862.1 hypothetical protein E6W39_18560 [Kitasatospora acidiphila]